MRERIQEGGNEGALQILNGYNILHADLGRGALGLTGAVPGAGRDVAKGPCVRASFAGGARKTKSASASGSPQ